MRKIRGKIAAAAGILLLLITGCGASEDTTGQTVYGGSPDNNPKEDSVSWQADYFRLENRYDMALASDQIYGCYSRDGQVLLDNINKEGLSVKEALALPDVSSASGVAADQKGNIYISENKEDGAVLWRLAADGSPQGNTRLDLEDTERAEDLLLKGIEADENGHLYIWCEMLVPKEEEVWYFVDRVYVKDEQFKTIFYTEILDAQGTQVLNFQIGTDGRPFFVVKEQEEICIQEIDMDKEELGETTGLSKTADFLNAHTVYDMEHIVSVDGGFLYCMDNALFEYHFDTQISEKILALSTYGIFSSDILFLAKEGDVIEVIDNHDTSGNSEYIRFTLGKSEKKTVTLGTIMTVQDLEKAVVEFNRYSSAYRIEIVDYANQTGNYEDAREQLKLDVVTGKAPDIIVVSGLDYRMFSGKGVLADLYGFMQEDVECSKSMLMQSVISAYEEEGHLYSIAPAFQIHSMWGYGDVTDGQSGVSFDELLQILGDSGKDLNAIAGFSADEPVLTRLCSVSMDEFVDWENGICEFDGDYFKKVLSFAKDYTGNYVGGTYSERIQNREIVMSVGMISSVTDYQIQKELYGEDVAFIGYPVAEGTGTAIAFMGSAVAVNAKKEDQDGAWEFVKFYLLHGYDGRGFPVVQEQFHQAMEAAMEEKYDIAENGETERIPKGVYNDGAAYIFVYAATQEDADAVTKLIESGENRFESHAAIQNIIDEEAQVYFAGQSDLDRTAEKIQNRVALLLQESRN